MLEIDYLFNYRIPTGQNTGRMMNIVMLSPQTRIK